MTVFLKLLCEENKNSFLSEAIELSQKYTVLESNTLTINQIPSVYHICMYCKVIL